MSQDFDNLDDFDVDCGTQLDGINIDINNCVNNNTSDSNKNTIKISIIVACFGFILIILVIALAGFLFNRNKKDTNKSVDTTYTVNNSDIDDSTGNNNKHASKPTEVYRDTLINNIDSGWVEIGKEMSYKFNTEIKSNFTVTEIKYLAKAVNNNNDKMVKSIVKGNISGLVGTYEIYVPYEKARYLEIGSVFSIKYKCEVIKNVKVIGEIEY